MTEVEYKKARKGTVQKYDRHKGKVWVKDTETGISVEVPFDDVKLIKTQENENV